MLFSRKKTKANDRFVSAIIAAAGRSTRMEGENKLFCELAGTPVIVHTLLSFEACAAIDEVIVVAAEDTMVEMGRLVRAFELSKVKSIVKGGETRTHSVLNGLLEASPAATHAAIHDGARPLVTEKLIERMVNQMETSAAAAPGIVPKDTIKRVDGRQLVAETPDRSALRMIQTPQVFDIALIKGALSGAIEDGALCTDDCTAVERIGAGVQIVEGDCENIKITTRGDLSMAEVILPARL